MYYYIIYQTDLPFRISLNTGNVLKHENVNIADLSNADRPTRLVRIYSDLFDNEWIDALVELMSKGRLSEKRAIEFLLAILLNAFQKCRQIIWDRYEAMKSVASTLDITHRLNSSSNKRLELLCSVLITGLEINDKDMPNLARYLTCCVEICWEMGIQDNPQHLDIEADKESGSERMFDTDKFRAYTKTGPKVDYIVWPALFVHEGAILSKGIAQGY
ncbi:hypothetical protein CHS0354_026313 [Potamilus streckersoni]|uniref:Mitochondria-eating protein n=1 Tax=Potamilus streckersoni TaxID=2493646 RepID=A0AAE0TBD3_9BIVA|nr:hypothetical protein CHS0354_026313 [Potamilus streckersoni]